MKIKWYGTATLLLESGDTRILIDPHLKEGNPALRRVPVEEASRVEAIFITHPHFDHFKDINAFTGGGQRVYVSENGIAHARANGMDTDSMQPLAANEMHRVGAFTVRTYQSGHCKFDAGTVLGIVFKPKTWLHFATSVGLLKTSKKFPIGRDIFALDISDGEKRVVVLGSAGMDANTEYPQGADLLVFPYQGRCGMHRYMGKFLQTFCPKAVMIDHFDDSFPPFTHAVDVKKFAPAAREILPEAKLWTPEEDVWYEV